MPREVDRIAKNYMTNPVEVSAVKEMKVQQTSLTYIIPLILAIVIWL